MIKRILTSTALLAAMAAPAFAHNGPPGHDVSLLSGLAHPFSGLDHMLAMVAVGLWASQLGGRAKWLVPAGFVGTMGLGFILGRSGMPLPMVEPMILASVVVLGLIVALAIRLPVCAGTALVGAFALFHGHAHAMELGSATPLAFGAGFVVATAMLHLTGLWLGSLAGNRHALLVRVIGTATALGGAALAFA